MIIQPIQIKIDQKLWEDFKNKVTYSTTLNQKICDLIKDYVYNKEAKK